MQILHFLLSEADMQQYDTANGAQLTNSTSEFTKKCGKKAYFVHIY